MPQHPNSKQRGRVHWHLSGSWNIQLYCIFVFSNWLLLDVTLGVYIRDSM